MTSKLLKRKKRAKVQVMVSTPSLTHSTNKTHKKKMKWQASSSPIRHCCGQASHSRSTMKRLKASATHASTESCTCSRWSTRRSGIGKYLPFASTRTFRSSADWKTRTKSSQSTWKSLTIQITMKKRNESIQTVLNSSTKNQGSSGSRSWTLKLKKW